MNAPPFPTNPSIGEFYGNWVWNGARWVCSPAAGVRVVIQTFTASGPYMPSSGLVTAVVECIGGGGGGGCAYQGATGLAAGGGGGGSGGYSRTALAAALVAGGVQVTIGAGGDGGVPVPTDPNFNIAAPGAATTFGALVIANGGGGAGGAATGGGGGQAGGGGAVGVGDMAFPGVAGVSGQFFNSYTTIGWLHAGTGGAVFGGNMPGLDVGGSGGFLNGQNAAPNTGAGGTGGAIFNTTLDTGATGGDGGSGICIVTEYCWADTAPDDDCLNPPLNVNARVAVTHVPWQGPGPCPPGWGQVTYDGDE